MSVIKKSVCYCIALTMVSAISMAQQAGKTVIKAAGPQYYKSPFYQSLWGRNYRLEWITPVEFPILLLDTAFGGLRPEKEGGGHQSKSLHLKSKNGKEYTMRTIDKVLRPVIPPIFYHSFVEDVANDEISTSHPYAALTIPIMAEAAGIYHTNPLIVYIPEQTALDTFNRKYANALYLLEQRPDGDYSDAPNLGGFKEFISSEKLREVLAKDNTAKVDQAGFIKARLFDMFTGDWDRHEDQWKWGKKEENNQTVYEPIPVDRDQPYAKIEGTLLKAAVAALGAKYLQSFDYDIPYPQGFSYERKNLDRYFTNKCTLGDWQLQAKVLQEKLTDVVIEEAIRQMPPAIFSISGQEIIAKLKSRRQHLVEYATKYYLFLARDVDVVGTHNKEFFTVDKLNHDKTVVNVYDSKNGLPRKEPYYTRTFNNKETAEIRLYGISGSDKYTINGVSKKIKLRLVGGDEPDSVLVSPHTRRTVIYDDKGENYIKKSSATRLKLSNDTDVHVFDYDAFRPGRRGLRPVAGYNTEDRIYAGIQYQWKHRAFRKIPYAFEQVIGVNYSLSQSAISVPYAGTFVKLLGDWDLQLNGSYDAVRWTNFYGLGNQTAYQGKPLNYFRLRTQEWFGSVGLNRTTANSSVTILGFYNSIKILQDKNKFLSNSYFPQNPGENVSNRYAGGAVKFNVYDVDDQIVPVKGVNFESIASYTNNLNYSGKSFFKLGADVQVYIPVIPKISLALSSGAATVTNSPEFYQYPTIGGGANLRGFALNRFRGKTAFYNSNELRYLTNINNYFLRGKGGLVAFFDDGRVWMPGEKSSMLHTGYGAGILIAPFNIMFFDATIGFSRESTQLQVRGSIAF